MPTSGVEPGAAASVRVAESGSAAVPLPAPQGVAVPVAAITGETVVHYHFPVEIEVRTAPAAPPAHDLVALALRRLTEGLDSA
jgi:hypothetical protein